jgi:hypothetical protein
MRRNSFLFISLCVAICSCASVKKTGSRTESASQHTDNSSSQAEHSKVTTVEETAAVLVTTRSDSAAITGYLAVDDTTGFSQTVTAGAITLSTSMKPRRNTQGQTTGYDITSRATKAPETVAAPVHRKTTIAESGKEQQQKSVQDNTSQVTSSKDKSVFRFNGAGAVTVTLCFLGAVALYLIYIYFKPKKPLS